MLLSLYATIIRLLLSFSIRGDVIDNGSGRIGRGTLLRKLICGGMNREKMDSGSILFYSCIECFGGIVALLCAVDVSVVRLSSDAIPESNCGY